MTPEDFDLAEVALELRPARRAALTMTLMRAECGVIPVCLFWACGEDSSSVPGGEDGQMWVPCHRGHVEAVHIWPRAIC